MIFGHKDLEVNERERNVLYICIHLETTASWSLSRSLGWYLLLISLEFRFRLLDDWGLARRCVDHKNISSFLEEEESHSATFPSLTLLLLHHLRNRSCSSTDQQAKISQIEEYFYLSSPLLFMYTVLPPPLYTYTQVPLQSSSSSS